jgi:hypothetical protein
VINLLNEYPVNATGHNAADIVATGKAISKLLVPEADITTQELTEHDGTDI